MSLLGDFFMCSGESYTLYNTLAYGLLFLFLLSGIVRLIRGLKLKIGYEFYLAVLPLLLAGPTVRVMLDARVYKNIVFPGSCIALNTTFGISLLLLAVGVISILVSNTLARKGNFYVYFGAINLLSFFFYHLVYLGSAGNIALRADLVSAGEIFAYLLASSLLFYAFAWKFWPFFLDSRNFLLVAAHLFDAATTLVGLNRGYSEQQIIPSAIIGLTGPYAIFALKLLVVPAVVWLLRKEKDRDLLYFGVFILGFEPAVRNFLRIVLGV